MYWIIQFIILVLPSVLDGFDKIALCNTMEAVNCKIWRSNIICGSDGKTYFNLCKFVKAQCKNSNLYVKHKGRCIKQTAMAQANNIILSLVCFDIVKLDCSRQKTAHNICGSDSQTYLNNCYFEKSRCKNHALHVKNTGPCA